MMLKTPVIIINFKAYKSATGKDAVRLAKICERVAKKEKVNIAVAVQAADIYRVYSSVKIPVLSQHIDDVDYGSHTGAVLAEDVRENGAIGTLLNHSEKRIGLKEIKDCVGHARKNHLAVIICSPDARKEKKLASFNPDFIAVEPPELIGGKISVSTAKPGLIKKAVEGIQGKGKPNRGEVTGKGKAMTAAGKKIKTRTKVIVGAGVHTKDDVRIALKLGAKGVLVASGVTLASDQKKALLELVKGMK